MGLAIPGKSHFPFLVNSEQLHTGEVAHDYQDQEAPIQEADPL